MKKAFKKRVKMTKTSKILVRKAGHGHFNAKERRVRQLAQKKYRKLPITRKTRGRYL